MEIFLEHMGKGFVVMLLIAMPCVLTAAGIGLIVGILQAVTQVQEQTIAAAPKILAVFLVIMLMGTGFTKMLVEYVRESANIAFHIVTKNDNYVLAPDETLKSNSGFSNRIDRPDFDYIKKHPGKIPYAGRKTGVEIQRNASSPNPQPNLMEKKHIMGQ